jgi:GalNAc5-diNAcBac-PP-undecaprenol beta-1,3-glucosyltransferase
MIEDRDPLFSVVMATYNRANLLSRAIGSVLNQSYQNFELIIVDDGSSDNTEEVCRSHTDGRIIYYRLQQNEGALAARNKGIDSAKGYYLTFMDDDDELLPEALETAAHALDEVSSKGIKFVWFDGIYIHSNLRSGFGIEKKGFINYEEVLCEKVGGNFWLVMRRDLLERDDRFDERLWGDEIILWLKLLRKSKALYVPKVLYKYYIERGVRAFSSKSRLRNLPRTTLTHKVFIEQYGHDLKLLCPKVYGKRLGLFGTSKILIGDKSEGRQACLESLKYHTSLNTLAVFMLSFFIPSKWIKSLVYHYVSARST